MTDRIDELQRLHEAATKGPWVIHDHGDYWRVHTADSTCHPWPDAAFDDGSACAEYGKECSDENRDLIVAMRNALPALLRVARAAKDIAGNVPLDIDPRIKWLEVQVGREEWAELLAAVAELKPEP